MLLIVLIPATWIAVSGFIVLLCRMAALSDREQSQEARLAGPLQVMSPEGILGWDPGAGSLSAARLRPGTRSSERVSATAR